MGQDTIGRTRRANDGGPHLLLRLLLDEVVPRGDEPQQRLERRVVPLERRAQRLRGRRHGRDCGEDLGQSKEAVGAACAMGQRWGKEKKCGLEDCLFGKEITYDVNSYRPEISFVHISFESLSLVLPRLYFFNI
jgi:hypothetical protein